MNDNCYQLAVNNYSYLFNLNCQFIIALKNRYPRHQNLDF